jgi:SAM-dependent methyltransferase
VEFGRLEPGRRILDVGCGAGAALGPAARTASTAVGIELSPGMAARAREAVPGAEVIVGDAAELPFPDASFDVVISAFTIFFMPDPTAALRESARVLAPGGRMLLATWAGADPRWAWEREMRREFVPEMDPAILQELGASLARLNRFDESAKVEGELQAAGLRPALIERHAIDFAFADEQAWWGWNWSHYNRLGLEALSGEAQKRFRERAFEAMQPLREPNGFPRTYTALFADARRAV